jgi:hypothetical protein
MNQEKSYATRPVDWEKKLQVSTYEFLKEPLIRKFGEEFYNALDKVARLRADKKYKQGTILLRSALWRNYGGQRKK